MKLNPIKSNMTELILNDADETRVLFSYGTPVACHASGQAPLKTDKKWSRTTSKHIAQWAASHGLTITQTQPQEYFDKLVA